MINGYTTNLSVQYLVALLKKHGIKILVICPGTTNLELSGALQYNGSFELYSSVDERSAAYIATGLCEMSGEPVAIACTESVASRNFYPAITEAYYRKLPILAITGVHRYSKVGHLHPQYIDRSTSPDDTFRLKVHLPVIKDNEDVWETELKINRAILELTRHGGGPVHIDLPCSMNGFDFSAERLPDAKVIRRFYYDSADLPKIPDGKIAVFIGAHHKFSGDETEAIDAFCSQHNAVVFCDHTSGYKGKFAVKAALISAQKNTYGIFSDISLLIHTGESFADEGTVGRLKASAQVWRVNPDGELRDTFGKLSNVFEMGEADFFRRYTDSRSPTVESDSYLRECLSLKNSLVIPVEKIPLSNIYAAAETAPRIPANSVVHLGVSNTIRAWSLVDFPESVDTFSNVGCRGIDGALSSFVGASFAFPERLCFCVLGDLTFFYDINSLGNRDIKPNARILLVHNNGGGVFKLNGAPGHEFFGDEATDKFIAAAGHYGSKSATFVKNYAESLGFEYMSASTKDEFKEKVGRFVSPEIGDRPLLFELFTNDYDERKAFGIISEIDVPAAVRAKGVAKSILGDKGVQAVKKMIGR